MAFCNECFQTVVPNPGSISILSSRAAYGILRAKIIRQMWSILK